MRYPGPQVTAAFVTLVVDNGDEASGAALAGGGRRGASAGPPEPPSLTVSQQARLQHVVKRVRDMFDRLEQQPAACAMRVLVFYEVGKWYGTHGRKAGPDPAAGANGPWSWLWRDSPGRTRPTIQ